MKNKLLLIALNKIFAANSQLASELNKFIGQVIELQMPGISMKFMINNDLLLLDSDAASISVITIPLAATSYLINQNQMRTFQQVRISGNQKIGQEWLQLMSRLKITNVLYQHDSMIFGFFAIKIEELMSNLIAYFQLTVGNVGVSTAQYLQYESQDIVGRYELEDFYAGVDDINSKYEILQKRMERLLKAL